MEWGIDDIRDNSVLLAEYELRKLGATEEVVAKVSQSIQHWVNSAFFEGSLNENKKQIESIRRLNESLAQVLPPT